MAGPARRRRGRRRAGRRGRGERVAGQQHGMVCLDEAGQVVRPALLWNDTRSAGPPPTWSPSWARATRAPGLGGGGRVGAGRLVHRDQAPLAGRPRAGLVARTAAVCLPARLAHLAAQRGSDRPRRPSRPTAATPAGPATGPRATGAYRPDLLRLRPRVRAVCCRGCSARPTPRGTTPAGAAPGRRRGRQRRRRARPRSRPGRRGRSRWAPRASSPRSPSAPPRTRPASSPDLPTRPVATSRWCARSTRPGSSTWPPGWSASTTTGCPTWRCPPRPARAAWCWSPGSRGSGRRTVPGATGTLEGLTPRDLDPRPPRPGGGRGHALRTGRRARRARGPRAPIRAGSCSSAAVPPPGPYARSRPPCWAARWPVPAPGEYVADGAARQAAWALAPEAGPPTWARRHRGAARRGADPGGPRAVRRGARAGAPPLSQLTCERSQVT